MRRGRRRSRSSPTSQSPIWGTEALRPLDLSLIETAKDLVRSKKGKPTQANLRRAVSTTYYALFHCLARTAADLLVGATSASRSDAAWTQAYRALDHGFAKGQCSNASVMGTFPTAIREFGEEFVVMQLKRHAADYAPDDAYYKSAVLRDIVNADDVIRLFHQEPAKDRRAFAAWVVLWTR